MNKKTILTVIIATVALATVREASAQQQMPQLPPKLSAAIKLHANKYSMKDGEKLIKKYQPYLADQDAAIIIYNGLIQILNAIRIGFDEISQKIGSDANQLNEAIKKYQQIWSIYAQQMQTLLKEASSQNPEVRRAKRSGNAILKQLNAALRKGERLASIVKELEELITEKATQKMLRNTITPITPYNQQQADGNRLIDEYKKHIADQSVIREIYSRIIPAITSIYQGFDQIAQQQTPADVKKVAQKNLKEWLMHQDRLQKVQRENNGTKEAKQALLELQALISRIKLAIKDGIDILVKTTAEKGAKPNE